MESIENLKTNWKKAHVLRLAEHFHEFNTTNKQHTRVRKYTLNAEAIQSIQNKWSKIKEMGIHLGLRENTTNENIITFAPIFTVKTTETLSFEMHIQTESVENRKGANMQSAFVPQPYVDMVTDNWNTLDFHLIDDLFVVQKDNVPVRVMSYHITKNIVEQLIKLQGEHLFEINLYLGVDMNKFSKTNLTSFTPVYGFKFKEASTNEIVKFFQALTGYKRNDITKMEEIFVQYSSPCPPTCEPYIPPTS
jgi:hypothetical protein